MPADVPDQITVRGVKRREWRELKAEAARHDLTLGAMLSQIIREWLASHQCGAQDQG